MTSRGPIPLRPISVGDRSGLAGKWRDHFNHSKNELNSPDKFVGSSPVEAGDRKEELEKFVSVLRPGLELAEDEKELQDAVFSALAGHNNIEILEESKMQEPSSGGRTEEEKQKSEKKKWLGWVTKMKKGITAFLGRESPENLISVAEKDTKTILHLYTSKYIKTLGDMGKMKEAEPGLFIKTSSRPEIVGMIKTQNDMLFAEVKNDKEFSKSDAMEQEICYLILLIYWWRVVCGLSVEKVYGFTICGPRCSTSVVGKRLYGKKHAEKQYHISLIELSIPKKLGQLNTASIWEGQFPLTDPAGLVSMPYVVLGSS